MLSAAEAAKAIRVTRQQLYNVINGRSAVTPEMAVRFEKAFDGGADMWLRMQAAHGLAKVRQSQQKLIVRRLSRRQARARLSRHARFYQCEKKIGGRDGHGHPRFNANHHAGE
jgi:antitoxin HigA-1